MARVVKYDILRITASFFIVLLHVSGSYWSVVDIHGNDFLIMTIYNGLTRFGVPVFFMLSGLFLVSPQKHITMKDILKRILKLLTCFYVWSAFYAFQGVIVSSLRGGYVQAEALESAMQRFLFGHSHMWFIQTLTGFYLLIPLAKQICENKKVLGYYLLLWVIFRFIIPQLVDIFHLYTFSSWINKFADMSILIGYFGYFILGYYLDVSEIKKEFRYLIYAMGAVSCGLTILLTILESRATETYVQKWMSPSSITVLVMSVAVFVFFKYREFGVVKKAYLLEKISGYTFFVYMFHLFIIEKLNLVGITTVSFSSLFSIPIMTVVVFAVSLLGALFVEHLPVIKQIVKP